MPLHDHFHAPLAPMHSWESLHSGWAWEIMRSLNRLLPRRYLATTHTHFGTQLEADVAEFEQLGEQATEAQGNGAVALQTWAPPVVAMSVPAFFPDELEVHIVETNASARLVAVVELVSPSNKDRPESRRTFAGKCAAYLQHGVGLVVVDIVTERHANLHNELMDLLQRDEATHLPEDVRLYAVAYRPVRRQEADYFDIWTYPLTLGADLPTVPLPLLGAGTVPLALEATYHEACVASRI